MDNALYKRIWPSLCDYFNLHEDMRKPLLDFVLNTTSKVKLLHKMGGKKPRTVLTFDLKGTTPSGHPIRTTVGNTLRTLMYYSFMVSETGLIDDLPLLPLRKKTQSEMELSQGGFPLEQTLELVGDWENVEHSRVQFRASGDDMVIICSGCDTDLVKKTIYEYTTVDGSIRAKTGLGQVVKEVVVGDNWADIDFCSKRCIPLGDQSSGRMLMTRDHVKALFTGMYYTGTS